MVFPQPKTSIKGMRRANMGGSGDGGIFYNFGTSLRLQGGAR
jgi:hypothetical protein